MTEQSVRYALSDDQREPPRSAMLVDSENSVWRYHDRAWFLENASYDDPGEQWFALLQKYGPIEVFRKTETKEF